MNNKNNVDMADVCELAHILTVRECRDKKIAIDAVKDGDTVYTKQSQIIYDYYYDLITNTLNV